LIKGGFLPDFAPTLTEGYAEWLDAFRARTTLELRRALVRDLARARSVGDWRTCEQAARACLALDPLNEEATLGLAEALAAAGSKAQAVEFLDQYLADIGPGNRDLRVPATVLRRRISERVALPYRAQPELPFVGREEEMLLLGERFQRARAGDSQCVVLHGEAGIGKSRLAAEFATVAALDGARVVRVSAQPHDVHRPMGVFVDLVPLLLELPGALGCSPESMAALKRLTTHGTAVPGSLTERNDDAAFLGIWKAISDLTDAIAVEAPLVILADDVHWADPMSVDVICGLISEPRRRRLMVLLGSRELAAIRRAARYADRVSVLSVRGIRPDVIAQLATTILASTPANSDVELQNWMVRVAAGNPLFISSLTLHYATTHERFVVPPTLNTLLTKRVDMVGQRAFSALLTTVILGKYCTVERLIAAADLRHADLAESIRDLEAAHLIVDDDNVIVVTHGLIADVVVQRTTRARLRLIHHRIAGLLEAEAEESESAALWWDCADHWAAAANYRRASVAFRRCSAHSLAIGRPREAIQFLSRALELSLPPADRAELASELVIAADAASEFVAALRGVTVLSSLAHVHKHDAVELAELHALLHVEASIPTTIDRLTKCVRCRDAGSPHRIRAGVLLMMLAHQEGSKSLADATRQILEDAEPRLTATPDGVHLDLIYNYGFGNAINAAVAARALLALASAWTPAVAAGAQVNAARVLWNTGHSEEATETLERCYRTCVTAGLIRLRLIVAARLGAHYLDLDHSLEPRSNEWRSAADVIARQSSEWWSSSDYLVNRVVGALFVGNTADAILHHDGFTSSELVERGRQTERWGRALSLLISQRQQLCVPQADVAELERLIRQPSMHEVSDVEAAVVIEALLQATDYAGAVTLRDEYLASHRMLRSPLDALLWRAMESLDEGSGVRQRPAEATQSARNDV
jgi:tetratricopeptide (TPR) repeat protein